MGTIPERHKRTELRCCDLGWLTACGPWAGAGGQQRRVRICRRQCSRCGQRPDFVRAAGERRIQTRRIPAAHGLAADAGCFAGAGPGMGHRFGFEFAPLQKAVRASLPATQTAAIASALASHSSRWERAGRRACAPHGLGRQGSRRCGASRSEGACELLGGSLQHAANALRTGWAGCEVYQDSCCAASAQALAQLLSGGAAPSVALFLQAQGLPACHAIALQQARSPSSCAAWSNWLRQRKSSDLWR